MFTQFSSSINKMFNSKNQVSNLAHNRFVLYFLLLISLSNIYYLVMKNEHIFAVIFILVGFVSCFFTKNMNIILFLSICITNILYYGNTLSINEGFDGEIVPEDTDPTEKPKKKSTNQLIKTKEKSVDTVGSKETDPSNEDTIEFMKTIKGHANELLDVQSELVDNMVKIDPIINKVSQIISKIEKLKINKGDVIDKIKKYETDTTMTK